MVDINNNTLSVGDKVAFAYTIGESGGLLTTGTIKDITNATNFSICTICFEINGQAKTIKINRTNQKVLLLREE